MMIEDGTGTGRKAKVTLENQLETLAIMMPLIRHINIVHAKVWTIPLDALAPSGATWFALVMNGGCSTYTFNRIVLTSSVAGLFRIAKVTGTPSGGTAISPVNLNLGSSNLPDLLTIQSGTSITGLTEAGHIAPCYCPAGQPVNIETQPGIILPPGLTGLALKAPAAATVYGFIEFVADDLDALG